MSVSLNCPDSCALHNQWLQNYLVGRILGKLNLAIGRHDSDSLVDEEKKEERAGLKLYRARNYSHTPEVRWGFLSEHGPKKNWRPFSIQTN